MTFKNFSDIITLQEFLFLAIIKNIKKMKEEIWKPIKNFEGLYEISNFGRIKSCKRDILCKDGKIKHYNERILKPAKGKYGRN